MSQRWFTAFAVTPAPCDRGITLEPGGGRFNLPVPLLWNHDLRFPIGTVAETRIQGGNLWVRAILDDTEDEVLTLFRDHAWDAIHEDRRTTVSVTYAPKVEDGAHLDQWDFLELSVVCHGGDPGARILEFGGG